MNKIHREPVIGWNDMTHYQMNGKEGLLLKHQGKIVFGEVVDGEIGERMEWGSYPVVAVGFLAYCCFNEPRDNGGDIYTPYFDVYYNTCMKSFREKHLADIDIIRDQQQLEERFCDEHIKEEKDGLEASKDLFDFLPYDEVQRCKNLYKAYMDYLAEKQTPKQIEFAPVSDTEVEDASSISQPINPMSAESKQTKHNDKPKLSLKDKMLDDKDGRKWQKLHDLMKGKKKTDAVLIIWCCMDSGWMLRPSSTQAMKEFNGAFTKGWYNECMRHPEKHFDKREIENVKKSLQ